MGAFDLVVHGLADVVQQTRALGSLNVQTQLRGHQAHQVRDFDGVLQDILRKTVPKAQAAQ